MELAESTKELEFIRKTVIMACHPECKSYEDALEKELGLGCVINCYMPERGYVMPEYQELVIINKYSKFKDRLVFEPFYCKTFRVIMSGERVCEKDQIIGQPITLARVLNTFSVLEPKLKYIITLSPMWQSGRMGISVWHRRKKIGEKRVIKEEWLWDLTEDLDDQSPELILAISKLLGYKNETTPLSKSSN